MKLKIILAMLAVFTLYAVSARAQTKTRYMACTGQDDCCKKPAAKTTSKNKGSNMMNTVKKEKEVACKPTSPELQKPKAEVVALLKAKVLERKEIKKLVTSMRSLDLIKTSTIWCASSKQKELAAASLRSTSP
jgi:hypothetical protein